MRQFATYFPATQRQNLPDKTSRFGKTSFPSPLQSVAERLLISFAPLNCCYHIINKLSLCQPIYRTKVHFLKIVQTTHTFSRFIDYQLFTPYILNTIIVIFLLTAKNPTETSGFLAEKESIRLTARTGEFTRIVERATESSAAQPSRTSHTSLLKSHYLGRQCSLFCSCAPSPREYTVSRGDPDK